MFQLPLTRSMIIGIAAGILVFQGLVLWLMGQPLVCECGHISLWAGEVLSPENSQQVSDWYTFSHIIHGFMFYALLWLVFPRMPLGWRLFCAMGLEVGWELFENTPWIINHYREQALAQGYIGDSVLNSVSDTIAMIAGFFAARWLPVWGSIALIILMEVGVGYAIRDGLILNIIGFVYQFEFITQWQMGN